jgi:hypothetical protein
MKIEFLKSSDFWAGVMFTGTGGVSIFVAQDYPFGSTLHMGPGYLPSVLGGVLILFGMYLMVMGMRRNKSKEEIQGGWSLRALIVLPLSLFMFGILMEHVGFIPALVALIFGSASAGKEFKFVEVLLLTVFLTVLSVAVFIWGLGLPFPLLKGF